MKEISVNTKIVPLLGKPLGHSYSVRLQNRIFEMMGLDYLRIPVEVEGEDVGEVIRGFRKMNIGGITATKPDKIEIMKYLDEIDPLAQTIGAVNCSVLRDGKLIGYNTDGMGFLESLKEVSTVPLNETDFFCFGAGGAGRAICTTLAANGARSVMITDIFPQSAEQLAERISRAYPSTRAKAVFGDEVRPAFAEAGIVMNISGVGMYPNVEATPAEKDWFRSGQIAFDATYNPVRTQFLKEAESAGCKVFNGKQMLAYCGMAGFRLITGQEPPREAWLSLMAEMQATSAKK